MTNFLGEMNFVEYASLLIAFIGVVLAYIQRNSHNRELRSLRKLVQRRTDTSDPPSNGAPVQQAPSDSSYWLLALIIVLGIWNALIIGHWILTQIS